MSFTATLDNAVQGGFDVDAIFTDGTATGGNVDYDSATQTLSFVGTVGETQMFTVAINNDAIVEAAETFTVALGNLVPATAPLASITITDMALGTINDNDAATVTIADVTVNEAAGTMSFTATLDNAVQGGFDVDGAEGRAGDGATGLD